MSLKLIFCSFEVYMSPTTSQRINPELPVEIDLWIDDDGFYLGHDEPIYPIELNG